MPCSVTTMNVGIITDQVTLHHGHSVPSTKTLWLISQPTRVMPPRVPIVNRIQYQRAKRAPASSATPTPITRVQQISPRIGFGKPNSDPCQEARFLPQVTSGLMLQSSTVCG